MFTRACGKTARTFLRTRRATPVSASLAWRLSWPTPTAQVAPAALVLGLGIFYVVLVAILRPERCPPSPAVLARQPRFGELVFRLFTPLGLILFMLGAIITGLVYTVEAAASGAIGATLYTLARGQLTIRRLTETVQTTMKLTAMVFMLLIGATTFSLVFRGFDGDVYVTRLLTALPGGTAGRSDRRRLPA